MGEKSLKNTVVILRDVDSHWYPKPGSFVPRQWVEFGLPWSEYHERVARGADPRTGLFAEPVVPKNPDMALGDLPLRLSELSENMSTLASAMNELRETLELCRSDASRAQRLGHG